MSLPPSINTLGDARLVRSGENLTSACSEVGMLGFALLTWVRQAGRSALIPPERVLVGLVLGRRHGCTLGRM